MKNEIRNLFRQDYPNERMISLWFVRLNQASINLRIAPKIEYLKFRYKDSCLWQRCSLFAGKIQDCTEVFEITAFSFSSAFGPKENVWSAISS